MLSSKTVCAGVHWSFLLSETLSTLVFLFLITLATTCIHLQLHCPHHHLHHSHGCHLLSTNSRSPNWETVEIGFLFTSGIRLRIDSCSFFKLSLPLPGSFPCLLHSLYLWSAFSRSSSQAAFPLLILAPSHLALCLLLFSFSSVISHPSYPYFHQDSTRYCAIILSWVLDSTHPATHWSSLVGDTQRPHKPKVSLSSPTLCLSPR